MLPVKKITGVTHALLALALTQVGVRAGGCSESDGEKYPYMAEAMNETTRGFEWRSY